MISPFQKLRAFWPQVVMVMSSIGLGGLGEFLVSVNHGTLGGMAVGLCVVTGIVTIITSVGKMVTIQDDGWPEFKPRQCRECSRLTKQLEWAGEELDETRHALAVLKID